MISIPSNWVSLRTKITGLAIIPALVCSVIFGLLIWATSISTAKLVGAELTNFMIERTSNGCIHGYHTSVVALGEVMDALAANLQTVHLLLEKQGGIRLNPGSSQSWQAVNDVTHETVPVTVPTIRMGNWQAAQNGAPGPIRELSDTTGRAVILFQRIDSVGDMMRVAESTPDIAVRSSIGSYIPAKLDSGEPNPMTQTVLSGSVWRGRSYEFTSWHSLACEPLSESGNVFGMLCIGISNNDLQSLQDELQSNYVGANGSVAIFYVHGKDRGCLLYTSTRRPLSSSSRRLTRWRSTSPAPSPRSSPTTRRRPTASCTPNRRLRPSCRPSRTTWSRPASSTTSRTAWRALRTSAS